MAIPEVQGQDVTDHWLIVLFLEETVFFNQSQQFLYKQFLLKTATRAINSNPIVYQADVLTSSLHNATESPVAF